MFRPGLTAGAEVGCNLQEGADVGDGLRRRSLGENQREESDDHGQFSQFPGGIFQQVRGGAVSDTISTAAYGAVDEYLEKHLVGS